MAGLILDWHMLALSPAAEARVRALCGGILLPAGYPVEFELVVGRDGIRLDHPYMPSRYVGGLAVVRDGAVDIEHEPVDLVLTLREYAARRRRRAAVAAPEAVIRRALVAWRDGDESAQAETWAELKRLHLVTGQPPVATRGGGA